MFFRNARLRKVEACATAGDNPYDHNLPIGLNYCSRFQTRVASWGDACLPTRLGSIGRLTYRKPILMAENKRCAYSSPVLIRLTPRVLRQHVAEGSTAHRFRVEVAEKPEHLQDGPGRLTAERRAHDAPPV